MFKISYYIWDREGGYTAVYRNSLGLPVLFDCYESAEDFAEQLLDDGIIDDYQILEQN